MIDLLPILEGLAYVGFIAGAIFAVLELREIGRNRRVDIVVDMYSSFISPDMTESYSKVVTGDYQNPEDMERKCTHSSLARIAGFYEAVGYLVRKKLVDPRVVIELMPIEVVWNKMKPWLLFDRERTSPGMWAEFEYLAKLSAARFVKADYVAEVHGAIDALKRP